MKPYDKLTIVRNRSRARDLRTFRERVEVYFERAEYDAQDDLPVDWKAVQTARSQINRMLPRILQIVHATKLGAPNATVTDPGPTVGDVEVLHKIFTARVADGTDQEILDLLDMALGVYEDSRFSAMARTVNPLYYVGTALTYVASLPGRFFTALGFRPRRARAPRLRSEDVARLEAVATRFADAEELIESRFAELHDRQAQHLAEYSRQLEELAERLDFAERVLAQQPPINRLAAPKSDVATPA